MLTLLEAAVRKTLFKRAFKTLRDDLVIKLTSDKIVFVLFNDGRVFDCLTRSQRRRRIGVQPISLSVAAVLFCNAPERNDASVDFNTAA